MLDVNVSDVSFVLEGGTFRTVFTMGVMDAFLDGGVMMPYISGVSAGITYSGSYITCQKGRNIKIIETYRNDPRYVGWRNFLTERSYFGLKFSYDTVTNKLMPFDWDAFDRYRGKMLVGVTNVRTGEEEYLDGLKMDHGCKMLQATCAIPFMFPAIEIDGQSYYDGGIVEPITIRKAEEDGFKKHIIVRTREPGFVRTQASSNVYAAKILRRKYPNLVEPLLHRHEKYNAISEHCDELERRGDAIVLRPDYALASLEKDTSKLRAGYEMGYEQAMGRMAEIREFCGLSPEIPAKTEA